MNTLTDTLFSNWHLMRWIRLVFSLFIGYQAIQLHDPFAGAFAAFFLFQALTNTGCCGSNGCATPGNTHIDEKDVAEQVVYEEIKNK